MSEATSTSQAPAVPSKTFVGYDFASRISNDLTAPILSIQAMLQSLRETDRAYSPGERDELTQIISRQTERLGGMLSDISLALRLEGAHRDEPTQPAAPRLEALQSPVPERVQSPEIVEPARLAPAPVDPPPFDPPVERAMLTGYRPGLTASHLSGRIVVPPATPASPIEISPPQHVAPARAAGDGVVEGPMLPPPDPERLLGKRRKGRGPMISGMLAMLAALYVGGPIAVLLHVTHPAKKPVRIVAATERIRPVALHARKAPAKAHAPAKTLVRVARPVAAKRSVVLAPKAQVSVRQLAHSLTPRPGDVAA